MPALDCWVNCEDFIDYWGVFVRLAKFMAIFSLFFDEFLQDDKLMFILFFK